MVSGAVAAPAASIVLPEGGCAWHRRCSGLARGVRSGSSLPVPVEERSVENFPLPVGAEVLPFSYAGVGF